MFHWNAFLRYTDQNVFNGSKRGDEKLDAPNWFMLMAERNAGKSSLMLRSMLSLDPLTEGKRGYPLLFQSGETAGGERLIDRQHPHDLVGELGLLYFLKTGTHSEAFAYIAYPGEPALGPPVYLHRPSALKNPDAPLGHHWQDSTHIVFGVATLGYIYKDFKFDASIFNGKEPDENRYDFDPLRLDSYSIRLSASPTKQLSAQVSHGYLKSPEALEPGIDQRRTTASLIWNLPLGEDRNLASSAVWGVNKSDGRNSQHSILLEADYSERAFSLFTRAEYIRKSGEELGIEPHDELFSITAFSLGASRKFGETRKVAVSLGAMASVYGIGDKLRGVYGDTPFSAQVFIRLSPPAMGRMHH